ncbi:hypothetical protein H0I76_01455 [Limibaculum sp. M0105]|uniref:Lipoprotein n=1 Tax=Thermohalobaculum xanthum TaxID=2753746 RepID=A0A8J7SAA1_9RHOB|nr:hypothetical protein [Thermohalobaculum xanthum]MBK0397843.1 hypothetical protein [Thermohalobaculum xanthum]
MRRRSELGARRLAGALCGLALVTLGGCDRVAGLFSRDAEAGLPQFQRAVDDQAEIRVAGISAQNRRYGYRLRRTGGLSLIGGRFVDVKYGVGIDGSGLKAREGEASLIRDLSVKGWKRFDAYGAAVTVAAAGPVYIANLHADMGHGPSTNYKQWNIDGVALERGGPLAVTMLRDAEIHNVTDALIDAKHRAVVDNLRGGNALHLLKVWRDEGEIVIANSDLSLGLGRHFIELIGGARVSAYNCRWRLPDGTVYTRLADIPDRYISLNRGAKRDQLVDLDADPLAGLPFFAG